jgi:hypothetical protein
MARSTKRPLRPKPERKPPPAANPRLTQQTRKILGKHYAAKYRLK